MKINPFLSFFGLFILVITVSSCSQPQLGKGIFDLEKMSVNIDVEKFYAEAIAATQEYENRDPEELEGKNEEELMEELEKLFSMPDIDLDSVYTDEYALEGEENDFIGIQYNMTGWSPGDSLAKLGPLFFDRLSMMNAVDGKFAAALASNDNSSVEDFKALLDYLTDKNGVPQQEKEEFFGDYYVYSWSLEDRILAISSRYDAKADQQTEPSIKQNDDFEVKLFILNQKYRETILGNLHSGDWLYFSKIGKNEEEES